MAGGATRAAAGLGAGCLTGLVASGCPSVGVQRHYLTDPGHFYASGVGALVPTATDAASTEAPKSAAKPAPKRASAQ